MQAASDPASPATFSILVKYPRTFDGPLIASPQLHVGAQTALISRRRSPRLSFSPLAFKYGRVAFRDTHSTHCLCRLLLSALGNRLRGSPGPGVTPLYYLGFISDRICPPPPPAPAAAIDPPPHHPMFAQRPRCFALAFCNCSSSSTSSLPSSSAFLRSVSLCVVSLCSPVPGAPAAAEQLFSGLFSN